MGSDVQTLAERVRDAGIPTAAVVSNWVLRRPDPEDGDVGLIQGFEHYDDVVRVGDCWILDEWFTDWPKQMERGRKAVAKLSELEATSPELYREQLDAGLAAMHRPGFLMSEVIPQIGTGPMTTPVLLPPKSSARQPGM